MTHTRDAHYLSFVVLLRLLSSLFLILCGYFAKGRRLPVVLAGVLLLLDTIDGLVKWTRTQGSIECDKHYQAYDKLVDQIQYAIAILMVYPIMAPNPILTLIVASHMWRWIGVCLFISEGAIGSRGKRWLVLFPDLTKELLVISYFSYSTMLTATAVALKVVFEGARLVFAHRQCDGKKEN